MSDIESVTMTAEERRQLPFILRAYAEWIRNWRASPSTYIKPGLIEPDILDRAAAALSGKAMVT